MTLALSAARAVAHGDVPAPTAGALLAALILVLATAPRAAAATIR